MTSLLAHLCCLILILIYCPKIEWFSSNFIQLVTQVQILKKNKELKNKFKFYHPFFLIYIHTHTYFFHPYYLTQKKKSLT